MSKDGEHESSWGHGPTPLLSEVAANFAQLASCIDQRRATADIVAVLDETEALCAKAAAAQSSESTKSLLSNLKTALETWRQVWPRLGAQEEFRQAVIREASLWSKRLHHTTE